MIDWQRLAELRADIGTDGFDEVVELFLSEVENALQDLKLCDRNPAALEAQLHFLKGSALNLGFSALSRICQAGEFAAATGSLQAIDFRQIETIYRDSCEEFLRELPRRLVA